MISAVIKTVYIALNHQPIKVKVRKQDPSTLSTLGLISHISMTVIIATIMAILFFNLEAAFPCLKDAHIAPACSLFSREEDRFLGGRSLIQAADIGNNFLIFGHFPFIKTFGFGFSGCSMFARGCIPESFERSLVCLLPSSVCT
jgi:hypothetical protein